jgi:esterase/lipase superfamily enzyme
MDASRANSVATIAHVMERDNALVLLSNDLTRAGLAVDPAATAEALLPLIRAGVYIAVYVDESCLRPNARGEAQAFGLLLDRVWSRGVDLGRQGDVLSYLDASLLTVLSFLESTSGGSPSTRKGVDKLLAGIEAIDSRYLNVLIGVARRIVDASGYAALFDARRAEVPWQAIAPLHAESLATVPFGELATWDADSWAVYLDVSLLSMRDAIDLTDYLKVRTIDRANASFWRANRVELPQALPDFEPPQALADEPALGGAEPEEPALVGAEPEEPALVGADPQVPAKQPVYRVWFGTDREPVRNDSRITGFTNTRAEGDGLYLGHCDVVIPPSHRFGETGNPWWKRWARLEFTDDRLFVRETVTLDSPAEFVAEIAGALGERDADDRTILIFIHGYNTSFDNAAIRAAQIGYDLKVPGVTAFYSWPSAAGTAQYVVDESSVETSEDRFAEFLKIIADDTGATRVNIVAHSMGNRLLARAAETVVAAGVHIGQIILAAPDIDAELFGQLAVDYPNLAEGTTMYVSAKDKALDLSHALHSYPRAGFTPPVAIFPAITTIEVTDIDLSFIGHEYFAAAEPVLYDIKAVLDGKVNPDDRLRLTKRTVELGDYWVIDK